MKKRKIFLAALSFASVCFCGCSHDLEITNRAIYTAGMTDFSYRGLAVSVVPENSVDVATKLLCKEVESALSRQAGYRILSPMMARREKPDVFIELAIKSMEGSADGGNFFVCWPGFLLFTHAWLGYGYRVVLNVQCDLVAAGTNDKISTENFSLPIEMRHAEFDRTWGNGISWFPLFFSYPAYFSGLICCLEYDRKITPKLYEAIFPALGETIAEKLVSRINALPWETDVGFEY